MALSGQKTVAAAGTAEALGSAQVSAPLMVKALDTNTGKVYIGNDGAGDVASANGLVLLSGEAVIFNWVGSLASLMVDVTVNGEGVAWILLDA
ncbi:MAG TPA: hypothetical protein VF823_02760 [Anaerolineales bacterium]